MLSLKNLFFFIFFLFCGPFSFAQISYSAYVVNEAGEGIADANVSEGNNGVMTDSLGLFTLIFSSGKHALQISHLQYQSVVFMVDTKKPVSRFVLNTRTNVLEGVSIEQNRFQSSREQAGVTQLNPKDIVRLPTAFGDFNKILSTLPGVVANNELSSAYAVRGGNFDENLVYVNGIEIYRPFLIRSGQQEGLSFVNTDLVKRVDFSSGGWQAKYGDKLSSSLNIQYKEPEKAAGSATFSLLGGAAHAENKIGERVKYVMGVRHKRSTYLLNTLETQGQYLPNFTDLQTYISIDADRDPKDQTEKDFDIGVLATYSRNRYLVVPESRTTEFGSFQQAFRLFVAFEGKEIMEYDTYQGGVKLTRKFNRKMQSTLVLSLMATLEREYLDLEGGYRLCDVDKNTSSSTFNDCVAVRGIGTKYTFARNRLRGKIWSVEQLNEWLPSKNHKIEWGANFSYQHIDDFLYEYAFTDSADYAQVDYSIQSEYNLNAPKVTGFVQHTWLIDDTKTLTYGLRALYWHLNGQFLLSPRVQFSAKPKWSKDVVFRASAGVYHQTPLYRELRNREGLLNEQVKAQTSKHFIAGIDYQFPMWGRTFKLVSEAYFKSIKNVIPYDIDNVRIRYFGENVAKAYATGFDFRLNGEFIPGSESWLSFGLLSTKEDIEGDGKGYIRRPSDQRANIAIFFQDHLQKNPTVRVFLNLVYGSGLPFGPPNKPDQRSIFRGPSYTRADLGFSKEFNFSEKQRKPLGMNELWLTVEVLNVFANNNVFSYTWIEDVAGSNYAIPNALSARFLNLKLAARF